MARIESSYTSKPEPAVVWFLGWMARAGQRPGRILDLGCGRGRNAAPFLTAGWDVDGLDWSLPALRAFKKQAPRGRGRLRIQRGDLGTPLPFPDGVFDAAMEITAADNLTQARVRSRFWREVARVIRPGGWVFSYHFTPRDGYYGPLLRRSSRRRLGWLRDPRAGMAFRFYGPGEILAAAPQRLRRIRSRVYRYPGPMFGAVYRRDLLAVIFRKR